MSCVAGRPRLRPFDLDDEVSYRVWRERKLDLRPRRLDELIVPVRDPRALDEAEAEALRECCRRANMAVYVSECGDDPDRDVPWFLGAQLGLTRLDRNWLADEDAISSLTVTHSGRRPEFIPYTNRPIRWHTDGYYNPARRQVRGLILHCVHPAVHGGENRLLDPELVYMRLRDANPNYVRALMQPDAMTIPARCKGGRVERHARSGPVFSVDPRSGDLHMRFTARRRNIAWSSEPGVRAALDALERILAEETRRDVFRVRLSSGMGLVSNNVLHDRSAFRDHWPAPPRLIYRARYYDRVVATGVQDLLCH